MQRKSAVRAVVIEMPRRVVRSKATLTRGFKQSAVLSALGSDLTVTERSMNTSHVLAMHSVNGSVSLLESGE